MPSLVPALIPLLLLLKKDSVFQRDAQHASRPGKHGHLTGCDRNSRKSTRIIPARAEDDVTRSEAPTFLTTVEV